jgi:hypothetical protein
VGVSLFSGTKRETLWDRDNLVGLLLIGIALSAHGGFDAILRSSPHAVFSGYVLGFSRSLGLSPSVICLYDLGSPPGNDYVDAPYRCVYIPAGSAVEIYSPKSLGLSNCKAIARIDLLANGQLMLWRYYAN